MFNTGPVFQANYNSTADIVINQGGTDSGKTYAIMQLLCIIAACTTAPSVDPIITILSASVPDSKRGAYRTFEAIAKSSDYLRSQIKSWHSGDRVLHFKTGWVIEFIGATDEQNAKQGKRQYLFVNEANGIDYPVFWQMAKRTRVRVFIDYNPSAAFWAHEKLIGTTEQGNDLNAVVQLIISDHRHNPFLTAREHAKTENIKDKELHAVYARGKTGNLTGLIHRNWKQIPLADFPFNEDRFGGLDFGYTNDPTAGVHLVRIANKIFAHELCYQTALPAKQLRAIYKASGFKSDDPIYCEHDPDMIRQLRMLDTLAIAARKGQGSIKAGIAKVNEYELYYTDSSKFIDFERKKYMWMRDPSTNKFINVPVDGDDHLMNAIRYGVYSHFYRAA